MSTLGNTGNSNSVGKNESDAEKISKLQERAKRKEAKKLNKGAKKAPDAEPKSDTPKETVTVSKVEEKKDVAAKEIKIESDSAEKVLSKAELRAQRREKQEAQRLNRTNAKNTEVKEQKPKVDITEKTNDAAKVTDSESKAELKAKRRALQEAQRLAKANEKPKVPTPPVAVKKPVKKEPVKVISANNFTISKKVQLFNHLNFDYDIDLTKELMFNAGLHPAIIRLGAQYMSHTILGSNARCLALLSAIKHLVDDFRTPPKQEFCRSLDSNLQWSINYLQKCRPIAVSMTNALRNIKWHLTQINANISDDEKKSMVLDGIDTYIRDEIGMADKAISITVQAKIVKDDVILTYGCSSIVQKILLDAHRNGKIFKVIVVDSRPLLEGREMLRKLVIAGIKCTYVLINAVSFIMSKATKVLLGAHALLANGYVMSRTGTAQVALLAQSFNKPVLVCCETYKFCERVQTDSIVHNEIGNPDKLIYKHMTGEVGPLVHWKESKNVTLLNLMYDVTPPDLVTAVVTELAILPCTSVPVILRIKPTEIA